MKLLHFTAEWCGPCKMMKPIIDEVIKENQSLEYLSIDIDKDMETTKKYSVMSVPTFVLLDDNQAIMAQISGAMPKSAFIDSLGI